MNLSISFVRLTCLYKSIIITIRFFIAPIREQPADYGPYAAPYSPFRSRDVSITWREVMNRLFCMFFASLCIFLTGCPEQHTTAGDIKLFPPDSMRKEGMALVPDIILVDEKTTENRVTAFIFPRKYLDETNGKTFTTAVLNSAEQKSLLQSIERCAELRHMTVLSILTIQDKEHGRAVGYYVTFEAPKNRI